MARREPEGPPPPPVVQRVRLRYAKRGRMRFASHRDFARAFERALRRAGTPMAYSAGFTPHPKISYIGAAPTAVASEAEYLEIRLASRVDIERLVLDLDAALPDGLDIVEGVEAAGGSLTDRIEATSWRIELPGMPVDALQRAVEAFLAAEHVGVERLTKEGRKTVDARGPVVSATVSGAAATGTEADRAILDVVVRLVTPAVRPDDVLAALRAVAGFALDASRGVPPEYRAMRVAQGPLDGSGSIGDPLATDRAMRGAAS